MGDYEEFLRAEIAKHVDDHGELAPPWAKFPDYTRYTIGWRMGFGESWMMYFHEWLDQQPSEREHRVAYLRRQRPAPHTWADFVGRVIGDLQPDEYEIDDERLRRLIDEGLVVEDVAYANWLAVTEDFEPPWTRKRDRGPASAMRYSSRGYTFWARWAAERRRDAELDAVLRGGAGVGGWCNVVDALRRGDPGEPRLGQGEGYSTMAIEVAAAPTNPRPPWAVGLEPGCVTGEVDDVGYADAWVLWVRTVFDDRPTRAAYLERWDAPAAWEGVLGQF